MDRREFLASIGVLAGAGIATRAFAAPALPTRAQVLSQIGAVNDYWMKHNRPGNNDWAEATYFTGDLAAYDATGQNKYLTSAQSWAQSFGYGLAGGPDTTFADYQAAGQVYIRLYQITNNASALAQITQSIHGMVLNNVIDAWTWIDAINMSMPCFASLGALYNDPSYWNQMYSLYSYTKQTLGLYNPNFSLWWRDTSYINTSYWSRGNGWVFAAHAKVLSVLPQTAPGYAEYVSTFQSMAARLVSLQTPGGYWTSDLQGLTYAGPESSGTAFFMFGLAWGVINGLLDSSYIPAIASAWNYFTTVAIRKTGFLGYVQPSADAPGSAPAGNTADFGVGAFLLGARQLALLVN